MPPSGIDESWGRADWDALKAAGVQVVSLYLSHDPSKNAKPGDVKAAHARGMGVLLNWEAQAGAPLSGSGQGSADALDWLAQKDALIKAVGYAPGNKVAALFSCDTDTSPGQYPAIDAYYRATAGIVRPAGCLNGVYGEDDLVDHLHRAGLTDVEWQTYAWSGGRLSPEADFYQYLNGQRLGGADVDFDRVIHASQLGAWWPPGSTYDQGDDMPLTDVEIAKIATAVWDKKIQHDGETAPAASWLVYANRFAFATSKAKAVAVDAAQLAAAVVEGIAKKLGG